MVNSTFGSVDKPEDKAPETVPSVTESNDSVADSVGEARPVSSDLIVAADEKVEVKAPKPPQFGPGSKVNWDNEVADPNKRKHVGIDPEGKHNAKTVFGGKSDE